MKIKYIFIFVNKKPKSEENLANFHISIYKKQ